jgi:hypothetical protein
VAATAEYVQGMAKELRVMAAKVDLGFLAYLLSMVEQEAQRSTTTDDLLRGGRPGG